MAGSELITEIGKRTDGRWKPSPGSIYPLLAWLQDNGYVKELPVEEGGIKRYMLTDKGKALLDEQREMRKKFRKEAKFMPPPFLGALWFRMPPERTIKLRKSMHRLIASFFELGTNLEEHFSEQIIDDVQKVLDETAERLEDISRRLKGTRDE
jgi:DNA-binding PadR family transcriptional regulator